MYVRLELLLIDTEKFFPFMIRSLILLSNPEKPGSYLSTSRCKINKTGNVCMTLHWGWLAQPMCAVGKQKYQIFGVFVCSHIYSGRNVHIFCSVLYCHLWPVGLYHIFSHYLINGRIFGNTLLKIKLCFYVLYSFCLKHFSFEEKPSEIQSKMYIVLQVKYPLFLSDFNAT